MSCLFAKAGKVMDKVEKRQGGKKARGQVENLPILGAEPVPRIRIGIL
jgi:hypothetical protein